MVAARRPVTAVGVAAGLRGWDLTGRRSTSAVDLMVLVSGTGRQQRWANDGLSSNRRASTGEQQQQQHT